MADSDDSQSSGKSTGQKTNPLRSPNQDGGDGWKKSYIHEIFQKEKGSLNLDADESEPTYLEPVDNYEEHGGGERDFESREPNQQIAEETASDKQLPSYLAPGTDGESGNRSTERSASSSGLFTFFLTALTVSIFLGTVVYLAFPFGLIESALSSFATKSAAPRASTPSSDNVTERSDDSLNESVVAARKRIHEASNLDSIAAQLLEADKIQQGRALIISLMAQDGITESRADIFNRSISIDDSIGLSVEQLPGRFPFDDIDYLTGGSLTAFKFMHKGKPVFSFKPAQGEWGHGWRGEVAAYRLCEMITCHFDVPRNWPVRISREVMNRYYDEDLEDSTYDELHWVTIETADGKSKEFLYGALERWIPNFATWPIEYTDIWQPWLSVRSPDESLDLPLRLNLQTLKYRDSRDFFEHIVNQAPTEQKTRKIARQLSSLLVFDYITMNWDRFSTKRKFFGTNNQYADGKFVSIDNGAAFSPFHSDRVNSRIRRVSRFSRKTVASIRALDLQVIDDKLLPPILEIDDRRQRRLSIFWEQRAKFLDRVDRLIDEHGETKVLIFE